MGFNHRFALRLTVDVALSVFIFYTFGLVLWIIDTVLGWNILPDWIDRYAQVIIIVLGAVALILVTTSLVVSLALIAEASANRAGLADFKTPRQFKRIVLAVGALFILLLVSLQVVDVYRKNVAQNLAEIEAKQRTQEAKAEFDQVQEAMNKALPQILPLFTPELLEAMETNSVLEGSHTAELAALLKAVSVSIPHSPSLHILIPADQPYAYYKISEESLAKQEGNTYILEPQYYISFPTQLETEIVNNLFAKEITSVDTLLEGQFINNTRPSSWGVLEAENSVVALVTLESDFAGAFTHSGPDILYSNKE